MGELRRAFHDTARAPTVIETVAKRGYRILQPVIWNRQGEATRPDPVQSVSGSATRRGVMAAGALLVLAAVLMTNGAPVRRPSRIRNPQRIVVLPLLNLSGDPEQEYLAEGMTEELISQLARIHSWRVISRR